MADNFAYEATGPGTESGLAPTSQQTLTTTYDVLRDFNTTGIQPASGDPFKYATEISLNVGFTLLPYYGNTSSSVGGNSTTTDGTVNDYYFAQPLQFSGPSIAVVATGNTLTFPSSVLLIVPDDVLVMMPGSPEFNAPDLIVTRFTAPSAGTFDIAGSFADLQQASVDLTIVVDGSTVFSSSFSGRGPYQGTIPFSITGISLHAGDTIDFVVDSLGTQAFDVVGLKAQITETSVMPTVTSITAATDNGATDLNSGHVITISLNLSAAVYVTGNPFLLLNDNEIATYTTGSGTNSLTFTYTVQQGENVPDLQVTGLNLNGGTIQDGAGAALAGPVQGDLALQIDTTPPTVAVSIDNTTLNFAHNTGTVTFTFSEAPTDFSLKDVTSADGSLSNLSGSGTTYTATFTANPGVDDNAATVSVTNGSYHDAAGNAGTDGGTISPVKFSSAVATFYEVQNNWAPSQMIDGIFTGPPPSPGQDATYGGVNGWSVFDFATGMADGADALLTLANPLPAGQYNLTFNLYQNYYGNPGHLLGDFALDYTTEASPKLSSSQAPVSIQSASSLNGTTFSFLSPGELLANTSQNSVGIDTYTISASVDSAVPITGIFLDAIKNPTLAGGGPGTFDNGNFVVSEFTLDAAGTGSTAPFTVDTVTPTVAVSIDNTDVNIANGTGRVTFAFSELPVAWFSLSDTSAVGGILSELQQSDPTHYTATFTGAANTDINNASVSVTGAGAGGSTTGFTVDTVTPTVAVSIKSTSLNLAHNIAAVTFTFSEAPVSFVLADTNAVGGTLSNLQKINSTQYTATFTAAANTFINNASVSVTAGTWQEGSGNPGMAGNTGNFVVDTMDHWTNVSGGNWTAASSWSNGVPRAGVEAAVDATGLYTVHITTGVTAYALLLNDSGGTITDKSGGTLTLVGSGRPKNPNGVLTINAGTFALAGGALKSGSVSIASAGHLLISASYAGLSNAVVDNGLIAISGKKATVSFAGNINGSGAINIQNGAAATFNGVITGSETFTITNTSKAIIKSTISGSGSFFLWDKGRLEFDAVDSENVTFMPGASGTLKLDHSLTAPFTGFLSGLSNKNAVDLADLAWKTGKMKATFSGDPSGGTLTVTNGTHSVALNLLGDYTTASWMLSKDSTGGTRVVDPPITGSLTADANNGAVGGIDLAGISFDRNTTLAYSANGNNSSGNLTVSDGLHAQTVALLGQYMASSFVMGSDGHGGTLIIDSPGNQPPLLTLPHA